MTRFIVVRHGNSVSNIDKTFTGHVDAPLSEVGERQAKIVSKYIYDNFKVDKIYSSDLSRAVKTIEPFAKMSNLPIIKKHDLREMFGGEWQGEKFSDLPIKFPEDFKVWQDTPGLACPTGGESYKKVYERAINFFNKISNELKGQTVVVCTHGGLIRAVECRALSVPLEHMQRIPFVFNASVSIYDCDGENFNLVASNVCDFLGDLQTEMPKGI